MRALLDLLILTLSLLAIGALCSAIAEGWARKRRP
jgi:hypothetical protein